MSEIAAVLPSKMPRSFIKKNKQNQSFIDFEIDQKTECPESFEWDSGALNLEYPSLAKLVEINYQEKRIRLNYQSDLLLSEAIQSVQLDNKSKLNILFQLVDAIYQLHKLKILGRCFSTSTITINQQNQIKLYRYGYTHNFNNDGEQIQMSPETLLEDKVQISSDIWTIGWIFYELAYRKPISNYVYPNHQSYLKFIQEKITQGNTFDNLYDNIITYDLANLLQMLLKFDPESRVESYWAFLDCLSSQLTDQSQKARLKQMSQFYSEENKEFQFISSIIESRTKKRDPPYKQNKIHKRSASQIYDHDQECARFFASHRYRMINNSYLRNAYTEPIKLNLFFRYQFQNKQKLREDQINFWQSQHFRVYQITFLQQLREQLRYTDALLFAKFNYYLLLKLYQIVESQRTTSSISSVFMKSNFQNEQIIIQKRLGILEERLQQHVQVVQKIQIFKQNEYPPNIFQGYQNDLTYNFNKIQHRIEENPHYQQATEDVYDINLRLAIAFHIEKIFKDKESVNQYFHCAKYFLGVHEITDPDEIERFLSRSSQFDRLSLNQVIERLNEVY